MLPVLISMPHCSNFVPADIKKKMNISDHEIASYSDLYTDEIYDIKDCYQVKAHSSRVVVDPNRAPDDIITESRLAHEGAIIQVTEDGKFVYKDGEIPTEHMIESRVEKYHDTFHREIDKFKPHCKFLIDGHSYKSFGPLNKPDSGQERADICLGNRHYTTCSREHTKFFHLFFEKLGYSVAVNEPYEGKYVLGYHCNRDHFPGMQIEFKRSLYMNEDTLAPHRENIKRLNSEVTQLVQEFLERFF